MVCVNNVRADIVIDIIINHAIDAAYLALSQEPGYTLR